MILMIPVQRADIVLLLFIVPGKLLLLPNEISGVMDVKLGTSKLYPVYVRASDAAWKA